MTEVRHLCVHMGVGEKEDQIMVTMTIAKMESVMPLAMGATTGPGALALVLPMDVARHLGSFLSGAKPGGVFAWPT